MAESVIEALRGKLFKSSRVLLVRAKVARDVLPDELRQMGAQVDVMEAYETKIPEGARGKLEAVFNDPASRPHVVTFTSSSTVNNFMTLLGGDAQRFLDGVSLASIGPVTSDTLRQSGFPPTVEAREYTMDGLVQAISEYVGSTDPKQKRLHRVK